MEQNWQTPSRIPLIFDHVQGILPTTRNQLDNLKKAEKRPYAFSDCEINRTLEAFKKFHKNNQLLIEQCNHWLELDITKQERKKVFEIKSTVNQAIEISKEIILRAEKYRKNTINKILEKDPAELALETLLGKMT